MFIIMVFYLLPIWPGGPWTPGNPSGPYPDGPSGPGLPLGPGKNVEDPLFVSFILYYSNKR